MDRGAVCYKCDIYVYVYINIYIIYLLQIDHVQNCARKFDGVIWSVTDGIVYAFLKMFGTIVYFDTLAGYVFQILYYVWLLWLVLYNIKPIFYRRHFGIFKSISVTSWVSLFVLKGPFGNQPLFEPLRT